MSTAAQQQIQATFTQQRTTPGTVVYKEQVSDGGTEIIGSVYLKKAAAKELSDPKKIVVTVNAAV